MGPSWCANAGLSGTERVQLLQLARRSIEHGLAHGCALPVDCSRFSPALRRHRACFVTLHLDDKLRGCVGSLRPRSALVEELSRAAHSAAFRDPRFPPLRSDEARAVHIHVSALSRPEQLHFSSEQELLDELRPGVDGVILTEGDKLGTFLPEVWERFPHPRDFLTQLRVKAGLPVDHWSETLRVERYTTESFD
jgi:hypothetical protein